MYIKPVNGVSVIVISMPAGSNTLCHSRPFNIKSVAAYLPLIPHNPYNYLHIFQISYCHVAFAFSVLFSLSTPFLDLTDFVSGLC